MPGCNSNESKSDSEPAKTISSVDAEYDQFAEQNLAPPCKARYVKSLVQQISWC
ncbi:hypothetical protein GUITHDRAFT_149744 [Guillardia theta CCMP2712]|uniref:Uncharacterized protein n=1 Tax=Guillardia theta (strain CCMP2712) TaxID=905079 RepID=L1K489_GUITC|nr:hypothetical protein GUITHDRAFT_149744 [Guillardia theta CCMP2712]EKX55265.1 hypothetical protein GUITHDRAFT_149744 [Guillardia theta CCMP2712]|eukprot:XP_005842245.1 hypothetical protein GUITHDRAFT_149744 [Guillardia theta CCMP2712]